MLEVHAPHETVHTWRDFFIHIATIVVGLLIAVGLEQVVEAVHQHRELVETREALEQEQLANEALWAANERDWRRTYVELKNNIMVLQYAGQHVGLSPTQLPGELRWTQSPFLMKHAAWDAAKQKGIVQRMGLDEGNSYEEYYGLMTAMGEQSLAVWNAMNEAHQFDLQDSDLSHLSAAKLERIVELTTAALAKHVTFGYSFGRFADEFPQRPHSITWDSISKLHPLPSDLDPEGFAEAHGKTAARLKAANSGPQGNLVGPSAFQ